MTQTIKMNTLLQVYQDDVIKWKYFPLDWPFVRGILTYFYRFSDHLTQNIKMNTLLQVYHDDVIKWKHFPRHWPFCAGNSSVTGDFPAQRPVTQSFDVFFDPRLDERLSKQSWVRWFGTPTRPLWRHRNDQHPLSIWFGYHMHHRFHRDPCNCNLIPVQV